MPCSNYFQLRLAKIAFISEKEELTAKLQALKATTEQNTAAYEQEKVRLTSKVWCWSRAHACA